MALLTGRSVLIVDDIRAMRAILRTLVLGMEAKAVVEANDGTEALHRLCETKADLIITDLNMKPMDGLTFTRLLRSPGSGVHPSTPIMMVSGHREAKHVKAALEAGVNEFLIKPITQANFEARTRAALSSARPIIRAADYEGPDRRRRPMPIAKDRRRTFNLDL